MDAEATSPTAPDRSQIEQAAPAETQVAGLEAPADPQTPGFRERAGMRRRLRFLRKARELAYRDLGGLVFEMHRLGERRDELVAAKLSTLGHIDAELRTLETVLGERQTTTVLREAGVTACPRCAAIHGSDDRFCPSCGLAMGRREDRPIAPPAATPGALNAPTTSAPPLATPPASTPSPAATSPSPVPAPSTTPPASSTPLISTPPPSPGATPLAPSTPPKAPSPATPDGGSSTPGGRAPVPPTRAPSTPVPSTPAPSAPAPSAPAPSAPAPDEQPTQVIREGTPKDDSPRA